MLWEVPPVYPPNEIVADIAWQDHRQDVLPTAIARDDLKGLLDFRLDGGDDENNRQGDDCAQEE